KAVSDRAALVARVEELQALADELEAQDEAVEAASDAIVELGYNLEAFDEDGEAIGTEENDVFVYVDSTDVNTEYTIELFGFEGEDVLFVGTEYTFNDDIENGNASVLEVFFTQDGDNTIVTVEKAAFGTNAAEPEIDEI